MSVVIRPSLPGDRWLISSDLRDVEIAELAAMGTTCDECMQIGFMHSIGGKSYTASIYGEPAAMFGVISYTDHNVLWGVFTGAIDRHPVAFLRASKGVIQNLGIEVVNYVDARNVKAVRWFRWLGFTVLDPVPYGLSGELFCEFRTPEIALRKVA